MIRIAKIAFGGALLCIMSVAASAEILIATVGPLKGQYAALGEQLRQGVSRAVADINAAAGSMASSLSLRLPMMLAIPSRRWLLPITWWPRA